MSADRPFYGEHLDHEDQEFVHALTEREEVTGRLLRFVPGERKPELDTAPCGRCGSYYVHEDGWCPHCDRKDMKGILAELRGRRKYSPPPPPDGAA